MVIYAYILLYISTTLTFMYKQEACKFFNFIFTLLEFLMPHLTGNPFWLHTAFCSIYYNKDKKPAKRKTFAWNKFNFSFFFRTRQQSITGL